MPVIFLNVFFLLVKKLIGASPRSFCSIYPKKDLKHLKCTYGIRRFIYSVSALLDSFRISALNMPKKISKLIVVEFADFFVDVFFFLFFSQTDEKNKKKAFVLFSMLYRKGLLQNIGQK